MRCGLVAWLTLTLVTACGVDLPLRDDVTYTCRRDADCPLDLRCATQLQLCVSDLDITSPLLTSITSLNRESVALVFDEQLASATAALASSFVIVRDDGEPLDVAAAAPLDDGKSIVLRTGIQRGAALYTVTTTVTDLQGNPAVLEQSTFVGFGPAPDHVAPDAIAPTNASIIVIPESERADPRVTLAWSPRQGAIAYTIELSSKPDFSVIDQVLTVSGDDASYSLPVAEGLTYFWRVRADASTPGTFGTSAFTVLFDTLYVYCPASAICRSGTGIGSRNVPLAAISRAVTLAADRGLSTVAIAGRGNVPVSGELASYHEPIALTGAGITLRGGYEGTFSAAPDRAVNRTRVFYEGNVIIAIQNRGPIVIEKLEIEATLDPTVPPSTQNLLAAGFQEPLAEISFKDALLTTTDVDVAAPPDQHPNSTLAVGVLPGGGQALHLDAKTRLVGGSAVVASSALQTGTTMLDINGAELVSRPVSQVIFGLGSQPLVASGGDVQMRNATLRGGDAPTGMVEVRSASGMIEASTFIDEGISDCRGVSLSGDPSGTLTFARNLVLATSSCQSGVGVIVLNPYRVAVVNNVIVVDSSDDATGVAVTAVANTLLVNNTIVIGGTNIGSSGLWIKDNSFPDVANNIFVCDPASDSVGVREKQNDTDPKSLVSNLFLDCDAAYLDEIVGTTVSDPNTIAGQTIGCPSCGTTRASGNAVLSGVAPFVSFTGSSSDLHLATSDPVFTAGGVDTTAAACGTNETPHDCGSLTNDFAGQPRTPPLSVGAYEKD